MAECVKCGEYTKFEKGLCYKCYKSKDDKVVQVDTETGEILENNKGLDDKDWNYRYNMIKGRIAETLIQELFL